jgi:hypothetical protein
MTTLVAQKVAPSALRLLHSVHEVFLDSRALKDLGFRAEILAGDALVKEYGRAEPVRFLAHSRASAFGPATFPTLLALARRHHPGRTEGVPDLRSRCGPSVGLRCASQTASVRSKERNSARYSEQDRCAREQYAMRESRLWRHLPCRILGSALSCVQRKV